MYFRVNACSILFLREGITMKKNSIFGFYSTKIFNLCLVSLFLFTQIPLQAEQPASKKDKKNPATSNETSEVKKIGGFPFYVYMDAYSKLNHFFPSGWMGDYDDMSYNNAWTQNPKSGKTCFRVQYTAKGSRGFGWAGIYWQDPINNWDVGKLKGGYDLTGARKIKFWARGEKGGEIIEFQTGGMTSGKQTTGPIQLEKEWVQYEMIIKTIDLSIVNGGFNAVYTRYDNPDGCVFYVDDIYFTDSD